MKTLKISALLLFFTIASKAQTAPALPESFQNALNLAGMTFTMPKDAIVIPIVKNMQMHYEYAVTFKDKPLEVRYAVSPMGYSVAEAITGGKGVTKHLSKADDNDMMAKVIAMTIAMNVAGGGTNPNIGSQPFPPDAVKKEFGTDWGSTTIIELKNNSFGTEYKICLMITIHKNDLASAYVFYLTDTKENLQKLMPELIANTGAFQALKFK
ncbi:hypothetical protein ACVWYN_003350 [Pedobacter sp. UYP24]